MGLLLLPMLAACGEEPALGQFSPEPEQEAPAGADAGTAANSVTLADRELPTVVGIIPRERAVSLARSKLFDTRGLGAILGAGDPANPEIAEFAPPRYEWRFARGRLFLHSERTGVKEIHGDIAKKWYALQGATIPGIGTLGKILTDELPTPDGLGRYNDFRNGSIYWHAATGATAEVHGSFRALWLGAGGFSSGYGYPTTDEVAGPDGSVYQRFSNTTFTYHPSVDVRQFGGAIRERWHEGGLGAYGWAISDERAVGDGRGYFADFSRSSIYWSPTTGAVSVWGGIREKWLGMGGTRGMLGYPTRAEFAPEGVPDGEVVGEFEGGVIYYFPGRGSVTMATPIYRAWMREGGSRGDLGYPIEDAKSVGDNAEQRFQGGKIKAEGGGKVEDGDQRCPNGTCERRCGRASEVCCSGRTCKDGLGCGSEVFRSPMDRCDPCGKRGQQCCNMECDEGLSCRPGNWPHQYVCGNAAPSPGPGGDGSNFERRICGRYCDAGYHPVAYQSASQCSSSNGVQTICRVNPSFANGRPVEFEQCAESCPPGYAEASPSPGGACVEECKVYHQCGIYAGGTSEAKRENRVKCVPL